MNVTLSLCRSVLCAGLLLAGTAATPVDASPIDTVAPLLSAPLPAGVDTVIPLAIDSLTDDTTSGVFADSAGASDTASALDSIETDSVGAALDTAWRVWNHPHGALGIGWSLGSLPPFSLWRSGLARSAERIDKGTYSRNVAALRFLVREDPSPYDVQFPVYAAWAFVADTLRRYIAGVSATRRSLLYQAKVSDDSLGLMWEQSSRLSMTGLGVDVQFQRRIDEEYFAVAASERTLVGVGGGFVPVSTISLRTRQDNRFTGHLTDTENVWYGVGFSWGATMTTLKRLSERNGLEVGLSYTGMWQGRFRSGNETLTRSVLSATDPRGTDPVSFVAHRFSISAKVLVGKAPPPPLSSKKI